MISRNKNLIYILVTTFILLNLASLVWLRYDNGNWLFDTQDYERNKHNTYKRFKEHNFPHPFIGYSRTTFDGTYDSKFGEKLFWDVYQTENFTNKDPTILILGGSVAMHLSNNASDRDRNYRFGKNAFANVLKRIYPNSNFRVLNAAYGGNKQPQQYLTAVYLDLLGVNYDLVLNLDGFNEISLSLAENLVQKTPPIYPRSYFEMTKAYINAECLSKRFQRNNISTPVPFFEMIDTIMLKKCIQSIFNSNPPLLPFDNYTYNESKIVKESVSIWATSSNKLHEFTTNKQIRYIHAIQPNQYLPESKVITSKELTILKDNKHKKNIKKYYGSLNPNMLKAKYVSDLRYLFKDNNVTLYRDSCCHLNHLGMGMISKKIIIDHKFVFNSLLKSKGDFNIKLMGKEITKVFNIKDKLNKKNIIFNVHTSKYKYSKKEFTIDKKEFSVINADPKIFLDKTKSKAKSVILTYKVNSKVDTTFQIFYKPDLSTSYGANNYIYTHKIKKGYNEINLKIPSEYINNVLRFDFVNKAGKYEILDLSIYENL